MVPLWDAPTQPFLPPKKVGNMHSERCTIRKQVLERTQCPAQWLECSGLTLGKAPQGKPNERL